MFGKKDRTTPDKAAPAKSSGTPGPGKAVVGKAAIAKTVAGKPGAAKTAPVKAVAAKSAPARSVAPAAPLTKGQRAYESRRAEKAGMGLDKWMAEKDKRANAEREALERARKQAAPEKKPGLLRRLLDKAHRPI